MGETSAEQIARGKKMTRVLFGHLDVCISIMDLLSCSVLRLSIKSDSTSARHRANVDNGVLILLARRVS